MTTVGQIEKKTQARVIALQPFTPPLDFPEFDGAGWGPRTLLTS